MKNVWSMENRDNENLLEKQRHHW